jgi:hypothetical protein
MAIDFSSSPGGLLVRLGKILHVAYLENQYESSLVTAFTNIEAQYLSSLQAIVGPMQTTADGFTRVASGVMDFTTSGTGSSNLAWDTVVQTVYNDQPSQSWTRQAAMAEVIRQMKLQTLTVQSCTVGSTATALTTNVGTGVVVISTKRGDGLVQENTVAESLRLICTSDSYSGGSIGVTTQGQEQFGLVGSPSSAGVWDYDYPSGSSAAVQVIATACDMTVSTTTTLMTDGGFETWSGSPAALTYWTLQTGTWGTDIAQSSSSYQGTYAVQFTAGTGVNTILYQEFDNDSQTPVAPTALTSYAVNFFIKRTGVVSAGVLTVELTDSSGTVIQDAQGVDNSYTITLSGLTTSYAASNAVFRLPANPPSVMRLRFRMSTALTGANILIDSVCFAPLTAMYTGGPGFAVFSAATPFVGGDGWTIANTNDRGGASYLATFQAGFDRLFDMRGMGFLLPSSGTPNVSDTLITA